MSTAEQLRALTSVLSECAVVGIDTEFLTFPSYRPALHVFQIASSSIIAVIDYQRLSQSDAFLPFLQLLLSREQVVLHSAQGDMLVLYDLCDKYGILPQLSSLRMFDTQMAAAYCGYGDMIGYGKLLADMYGVHVSKSDQMTDWSRRPLTAQQLQYAINDVRYLHSVYDDLSRELRVKGRWEWAAEEMAAIPNQQLYAPIEPRDAWRLIWGGKKLDEHSDELSVLRELCEWRELTARARNQSVNLLLRDDTLVATAQQMPATMQELEAVQGMKPAVVSRYGRQMLDAVRRGRYEVVGDARAALYHRVPHKQALRLREGLFNLLTSRAAAVAQQSGISLYQIAPRNELLDLASVSEEAIKRMQLVGREGGVRSDEMRPVRMISNYYGVKHELLPFELSTAPRSLYARRKERVEGEAVEAGLARALSGDEEVEMLCKLKVLSGWRRQLVGNDLLDIACGESIAWSNTNQSAMLDTEQQQQQQQPSQAQLQDGSVEWQLTVEAEAAAKQRADQRLAALRLADVDVKRAMAAWLEQLNEQERAAVYKAVAAIVQCMEGAAADRSSATADRGSERPLDASIVSEMRELVTRIAAMQQQLADGAAHTATKSQAVSAAADELALADEVSVEDKPRARRTRSKASKSDVALLDDVQAVDKPRVRRTKKKLASEGGTLLESTSAESSTGSEQ